MTKKDLSGQDKSDIQAVEKVIRLIKKGWGGGHTKKHKFEFQIQCAECQAQIVVSWLEEAIENIRFRYQCKKQ